MPDSREQLARIFSGIVAADAIPSEWFKSKVTLIQKRGSDPGLVQNYRPVIVARALYRVFAHIIKASTEAWAEANDHPTELQHGFRQDRRLEDYLFALSQCLEIARKESHLLLCCFLDGAHDNVLIEIDFTAYGLINMLRTRTAVLCRMCGVKSREVDVNRELKQGCPLFPLLYMLYAAQMQ